MHAAGPKNPLHGITLAMMLEQLVAHYGWEMLGQMIKINCFNFHPSIQSSLVFLRRTPWARAKVEELLNASGRMAKTLGVAASEFQDARFAVCATPTLLMSS